MGRALPDIQCGQHIARFPLYKEAQKGGVKVLKTEFGTQFHYYQLLVGLNAFFIAPESLFPELKFLLRYSRRCRLKSALKGYWHERNALCLSQNHQDKYFPMVCIV